MELDQLDRSILRVLQKDGRIQNTELAAQVGLSPSPCLRRVRNLEEAGAIDRYVAVLDPAKIGMSMTFFTRVWLTSQDEDTVYQFVSAIKDHPQVVECYLLAGDSDFLLRVVAPDIDGYRRFQVEYLGRAKGVRNIKTEIPMQKFKHTTALPL
ncbi:Lrp/AsnC family transcriptional regulator [Paracoccus aminophilus]|uniref:Lrp/AsnC family transcriptional regulator n=1 Tax=Paracoccus aminophilus TaxID=34003 RepID=UPI0005A23500|nr:Lrp/AsnC family transcriptional regulator [Paracoccus aminophilus]